MVSDADHEVMSILLIIVLIAVVFTLAALYGVDSRPVEGGRHRPNWR